MATIFTKIAAGEKAAQASCELHSLVARARLSVIALDGRRSIFIDVEVIYVDVIKTGKFFVNIS